MKSVLEKSNSFFIIYPISAKLLALNITHPIMINIIAYIHCTNLGSLFNNLPNKYMIGIYSVVLVMMIFYKKYRKDFINCLFVITIIFIIQREKS